MTTPCSADQGVSNASHNSQHVPFTPCLYPNCIVESHALTKLLVGKGLNVPWQQNICRQQQIMAMECI